MLYALHDHPLLQPRGEMDTAAYVELASHPNALPYFVSPLYLYFLRLLGVSLLAARIVQILLGSVAVVLIFDTARRWMLSREALEWSALAPLSDQKDRKRRQAAALQGASRFVDGASVAAILAILTGVITFYEVTILQAALDPFLIALTLWLLTIALQTGARLLPFAATGVALGLFVLNRPNALLWLPVLAIGIVIVRSWRAALVLTLGLAIPIAPVTIRNYVVSHELVLIASHGGLNFYIGNNAEADGTYHHVEGIRPTIAGQEADAPRVAAAAMHKLAATPDEASRFFYRQAWSWIRTHPGAALALFLRKIAYTFNQTDLALNHSYAFFTRDVSSLLKFLVVGPWLLFPLGMIGTMRLLLESGPPGPHAAGRPRPAADESADDSRRVWRPGDTRTWTSALHFAIWASFIPLYALAVAVFFVSSRYRLPLLIPMCVTAAAMFARPLRIWQWAAAAVLAVGVCWNFGLDDGRAHERTNMIVYLVEQHRFDEAMGWLDSTAAITRDPGTLFLRGATAFESAGDPAGAFQIVRRADPAQLPPAQAMALAQLARTFGVNAVRSNDSNKALDAFTTAHRLDPHEASDLLNVAVLLAQRGDFRSARENATAALRLRPGYPQAIGLLQAIEGR